MRAGFVFMAALIDATPVRVVTAFDHEETIYLEHVWLRRADGTDGPDFLDILSHESRFELLAQAAKVRACRVCGCTETNACLVEAERGGVRGCAWDETWTADTCTACSGSEVRRKGPRVPR